jgi:hypothetical protein
MWQFLPEEIELSMVAAIRALGPEVVSAEDDWPVRLDREGLGREMVHLVFGADEGGGELPEVLAALVSDPDSQDAREGCSIGLSRPSTPIPVRWRRQTP